MLTFSNIIQNKSVALVGNASSLMKMNKGSEIDSHDIVIRINKPGNLEYGEEYSHIFGKKMDIWCLWNFETFVKEHKANFMQKYYPYFSDKLIYKTEAISRNDTKFYNVETLYNSQCLTELEKLVLSQNRPRFKRKGFKFSTGFLLINYIANINVKCLNIYGMDFKVTPTYYDKENQKNMKMGFDLRCGHDYWIEKRHVSTVMKTNKKIRLVGNETMV
jgi:hypothetical protein